MEVGALGASSHVTRNGATIADIEDPSGRRSGVLALQLHGGMDMKVEYPEIRLRPCAAQGKRAQAR